MAKGNSARREESDHSPDSYVKESILEAVNFAAERFLKSSSWKDNIQEVLQRLGQSAQVCRAYIFENARRPDGVLLTTLRYEWHAPEYSAKSANPTFKNFPIEDQAFMPMLKELESSKPLQVQVKDFPKALQPALTAEKVKSFAMVPIIAGGNMWGFMGFDECRQERVWTTGELKALLTAANILGGAIESQQIRTSLEASEAELRAIFTAMRHVVLIVDDRGVCLRVAPTDPAVLLRPVEDIVGRSVYDFFPKDRADAFMDCLRRALKNKEVIPLEYPMTGGPPPGERWFTATIAPLSSNTILLAAQDVTSRKAAEEAMRTSETKYRNLFANLLESVYQSAPDGTILSANPAMVRLLGYDSEEDLRRINATDTYADPEDRKRYVERVTKDGEIHNFETQLKRKDGQEISVLINSRAVRNTEGEILYYEGTITDITDRKRLEAQLRFFANRDPLTNLFNRRRFQEELDKELPRANRYSWQAALLWVDIDHFKTINDEMGHHVGDLLLESLGQFLPRHMREHDVIARMGGDEFAIFMPHVDALQTQAAASRLLEAVRRHTFEIGDQPIHITISIGIALYPEHASTSDKLLVHADLAQYRAKEDGRDRFSFYKQDEERRERFESRTTLVKGIRNALENDRFLIYAQPVLRLADNSMSHHELLLRLEGDEHQIIAPDVFLSVAVKFNMIQEIDHWVTRQSIALLRERGKKGRLRMLEINYSAKAFVDVELLGILEKELADIDPSMLIIDVTENATVADFPHAQKFIGALKKLGCRCALDDFGVGMTSFQHLKHLPLDFLKIDGSLIRNVVENKVSQHIVQAITQLAHSLNMQTIAESVDTEESIWLLREYGVDFAQGFEIGLPQPLVSLPWSGERP